MLRFVKIMISALIVAAVFLLGDRIIGIVSSPRVISISPANAEQNVVLDSELIINFDKPIVRQKLQRSISPEVYGEWRFENPLIRNHLFRSIIFTPATKFEPGTDYYVDLKNIKSFGPAKPNSFSSGFTAKTDKTSAALLDEIKVPGQPEITLIKTPFYWQEHNLSCEAASLRMALAAKGVFVSENEIMGKIGYDRTPHINNIWGDPYNAFVGDIDGKIGITGYGVYWDPLAKAANDWRESQAFSNWDLKDLIKELLSGNPVIVWGALPVETVTDISWLTPEGKFIKAFKETHVRLAVGFIGDRENPSQIILNDPLAGRLYWPTSYFLENWRIFGYSGVTVR